MTVFTWDKTKETENRLKHGVSFALAKKAFDDPNRIIHFDPAHSGIEERYFCFGKVGEKVLTVRFTHRETYIRIIGAGYWRKGEKIYAEKNEK